MKPFNLAETRIAERIYCQQRLNHRLRIIVLLVVATIFVAAGSYACRMMFISKETRTVSELADAYGRTTQIKREIAQLKAELGQRQWREQLARGSRRWLDVIRCVLRSLPPDVWLTCVESSEKDSAVSIEGNVASFESLSGLVNSLRNSPEFSDVRLRSATLASEEGSSTVNFAILAKLKGGSVDASKADDVARAGQVPRIGGMP